MSKLKLSESFLLFDPPVLKNKIQSLEKKLEDAQMRNGLKELPYYTQWKKAESELQKLREWHTPNNRPDYNPDDNSFSVIVRAQWDDGLTAEVWFDFQKDCWLWDGNSNPVSYYGNDFEWIYLPERELNQSKDG